MISTKGSISVTDLSKSFKLPHEKTNTIKGMFLNWVKLRKNRSIETQKVLKDINLEVRPGEFLGVVGRNGSGKSTLLKILAGIYQPSAGDVHIKGKLVPFIELGVGFNGELSGRDNVYLNGALFGFSKIEMDGMYRDIVAFAELEKFMDQKLKNYSSGMQVRLAFSIAVRAKADILLIDEVLAVGDAAFQRKCFDYFKQLKKQRKTVIFVTHDMGAVREYCDQAVLIENKKILYKGDPADVATEYNKLFARENPIKTPRPSSKKRRGNKAIFFTRVEVPKWISRADHTVEVKLTAKVKKSPISSPNFGISIQDASGAFLCGTNSKIIGKKIGELEKGQIIHLNWQIPNIFNDGLHYVNVAVVGSNETEQYDWWDEAAVFSSYRDDKTPYPANPRIELELSK